MSGVTGNTKACFDTFIGKRVVGVLFGALPVARPEIARGTKTLIFEDGRGLTFSGNGSYWVEGVDAIADAVRCVEAELRRTEKRLPKRAAERAA